MNTSSYILKAAAVLPVILAFTSCSTDLPGEHSSVTTIEHGTPGGVITNAYREVATVTAIDRANREITLVDRAGHKNTVKAGPEVRNFAQIAVGDQVKTTFAEQIAIHVRQPGEPPPDTLTTDVYLAKKGAKPHAAAAESAEVTGRVTAINLKRRTATLQFRDGSIETFKVRGDVDLTKQRVGSDVTFRVTQAVAIKVEKP
jgi:hypothetical protein